MAFRPTKEILDPSVVWIPKTFTLDNLRLAWELMDYGSVFRNTLLINIISSLLQVATCAVTSYTFARFQFKGKQLLFGIVIFSIMIPSQLTIIPLSRSFSHFDFFGIGQILKLSAATGTVNLLDTPAPFYISALFGAGIKSGMFIFIFRQFFRGLPKEPGGGVGYRRLRLRQNLSADYSAQRGAGVRVLRYSIGGMVLERLLLLLHVCAQYAHRQPDAVRPSQPVCQYLQCFCGLL